MRHAQTKAAMEERPIADRAEFLRDYIAASPLLLAMNGVERSGWEEVPRRRSPYPSGESDW